MLYLSPLSSAYTDSTKEASKYVDHDLRYFETYTAAAKECLALVRYVREDPFTGP